MTKENINFICITYFDLINLIIANLIQNLYHQNQFFFSLSKLLDIFEAITYYYNNFTFLEFNSSVFLKNIFLLMMTITFQNHFLFNHF